MSCDDLPTAFINLFVHTDHKQGGLNHYLSCSKSIRLHMNVLILINYIYHQAANKYKLNLLNYY